ncbi:MAG: electron transport complex subunit RsxC [Chitinispirillaceae bacterium]|nr:electron transport complex subunit RsxC [Chitinispirillaceae bacterium]
MARKFSFKGGIHPPHSKKKTEHLTIEQFPAPQKVIVPLSQHIGAPAKPLVKKGDRVLAGQLIAESSGFVSAVVHSSISGTVQSVGPFPHPCGKKVISIEIENDGLNEMAVFSPLLNWRDAAQGELVQKIQAAGIVGMGGASFPTHVKLSPPSNKTIDTLIINGAECEPYLTADHRLMLERTEQLLTGILILKKILSAQKCFIGIEENKLDAIQAVTPLLKDQKYREIKFARLKVKYPQGGEKQLINAITGREVPSGGLPMDAGCVVQNIGTAVAVCDAVIHGVPLFERVVTVCGPVVKHPKNYLVRIGTPLRLLLEATETDLSAAKKVIMGGPMMGTTQSDLDAPVIKSTSGILVLDSVQPGVREHPCINCGHCVHACPVHLIPSRLAKFVEKENMEEAVEWNIMDCMECGSCTFVCPSKINLVHFIRLGKFRVQAMRAAKAPGK